VYKTPRPSWDLHRSAVQLELQFKEPRRAVVEIEVGPNRMLTVLKNGRALDPNDSDPSDRPHRAVRGVETLPGPKPLPQFRTLRQPVLSRLIAPEISIAVVVDGPARAAIPRCLYSGDARYDAVSLLHDVVAGCQQHRRDENDSELLFRHRSIPACILRLSGRFGIGATSSSDGPPPDRRT